MALKLREATEGERATPYREYTMAPGRVSEILHGDNGREVKSQVSIVALRFPCEITLVFSSLPLYREFMYLMYLRRVH